MCTIRLIKLTVAWQNSKQVSFKMHAFLQNAISFALLYSGLYEPISKPYIYKNSAVYARVTFFLFIYFLFLFIYLFILFYFFFFFVVVVFFCFVFLFFCLFFFCKVQGYRN